MSDFSAALIMPAPLALLLVLLASALSLAQGGDIGWTSVSPSDGHWRAWGEWEEEAGRCQDDP